MFKVLYLIFFWSVVTISSTVTYAKPWKVNQTESSIKFSGTHAGNTFVGKFSDWKADIVFDPKELPKAHVKVDIAMSSAVTGNSLYDGTLKGEDWFDVESYAEAVFVMTSVTLLNEGSYHMKGKLTLKDKSVALEAPFKLAIEGSKAEAVMEFTLDRMELGLGMKSDASANWVSQEISLKVVVSAYR